MKRMLMLLTLLLVSGCSDSEIITKRNDVIDEAREVIDNAGGETTLTAHINIRDDMIGDSYQVMRMIEKSVDEDKEIKYKILNDYQEKYLSLWNDGGLTEEEKNLYAVVAVTIEMIDDYITIGSERMDFEIAKERFYEVLENGK